MSAAVPYVVFALWPLIALVGALGFALLIGLAAIPTGPISIRRFRLRFLGIAQLALFDCAEAAGDDDAASRADA